MKFRASFMAITSAITLALVAAPANASVADGFIGGGGNILDDWGDEGPISRTQRSYSNATGLWQMILYYDGVKESNGTRFDASDIDCDFGPNTEYATKQWQAKHGFTGSDVDGIVGPKTWAKAGLKLFKTYGTDSFATYPGDLGGEFDRIDIWRHNGRHRVSWARDDQVLYYSGAVTLCA